jgi:hypothetical protein
MRKNFVSVVLFSFELFKLRNKSNFIANNTQRPNDTMCFMLRKYKKAYSTLRYSILRKILKQRQAYSLFFVLFLFFFLTIFDA